MENFEKNYVVVRTAYGMEVGKFLKKITDRFCQITLLNNEVTYEVAFSNIIAYFKTFEDALSAKLKGEATERLLRPLLLIAFEGKNKAERKFYEAVDSAVKGELNV